MSWKHSVSFFLPHLTEPLGLEDLFRDNLTPSVSTRRHAQLYKCRGSGLSAARCVCVLSVAILLTFHGVNRNVVYLFTSVCAALIKTVLFF